MRASVNWESPDGTRFWAWLPGISDPYWTAPASNHPGRARRRHLRALMRSDRRTRRTLRRGWPAGWIEIGYFED